MLDKLMLSQSDDPIPKKQRYRYSRAKNALDSIVSLKYYSAPVEMLSELKSLYQSVSDFRVLDETLEAVAPQTLLLPFKALDKDYFVEIGKVSSQQSELVFFDAYSNAVVVRFSGSLVSTTLLKELKNIFCKITYCVLISERVKKNILSILQKKPILGQLSLEKQLFFSLVGDQPTLHIMVYLGARWIAIGAVSTSKKTKKKHIGSREAHFFVASRATQSNISNVSHKIAYWIENLLVGRQSALQFEQSLLISANRDLYLTCEIADPDHDIAGVDYWLVRHTGEVLGFQVKSDTEMKYSIGVTSEYFQTKFGRQHRLVTVSTGIRGNFAPDSLAKMITTILTSL